MTTDVKTISLLACGGSFVWCKEKEKESTARPGTMHHLHNNGLRQDTHTHTHLITFSQVLLSSVAINRVCGRALANSFIESLVVTQKDAHTHTRLWRAAWQLHAGRAAGLPRRPLPLPNPHSVSALSIHTHLLSSPSLTISLHLFLFHFNPLTYSVWLLRYILVLYIFITHDSTYSLSCVHHQLLSHSFNWVFVILLSWQLYRHIH